MKTIDELEKERNEAKQILDSHESELIEIVNKIDSLKKIYAEHSKQYLVYQKNFIKADTNLNKAKKGA